MNSLNALPVLNTLAHLRSLPAAPVPSALHCSLAASTAWARCRGTPAGQGQQHTQQRAELSHTSCICVLHTVNRRAQEIQVPSGGWLLQQLGHNVMEHLQGVTQYTVRAQRAPVCSIMMHCSMCHIEQCKDLARTLTQCVVHEICIKQNFSRPNRVV